MAELRRKLRRGLAGFLALCMTITSFTGISWADEDVSYDVSVKLEGAGIWEAAQEAITNGTQVPLDEELDEADTETARFYGLFDGTGNKGSVYEMTLDYEYETGEDEDVPSGADFSVYVRTKKPLTEEEAANYKITGNEQIIFLFYNDSEAVLRYQLHIDGQVTSKIRVNKYEEKLETAVPGLDQNKTSGGANGQTPESGNGEVPPAEEGIPTPEGTTAAEETTVAETTETDPVETLAPSPEETPVQEETSAPVSDDDTTVTPEETPAATPEETDAAAPEETANPAEAPAPVPEETPATAEETQVTVPEAAENPAEAPAPVPEEPQESDVTVSMSRNESIILMSSNPDSDKEVSTASQLNSTASPSNGDKIKGEIVKRGTFDEDGYNVTVFAVSLKDIPKTEQEGNYHLTVEHDLAYGGKIYYDEQAVSISEELFDENFAYDFSNDVYEGETYHKGGLLLKTPEEELKVLKDSFVYNEETEKYEAKVIINYELKEGWQVVDDKIEEVKPISYYQRRASSGVEKQAGIQTMAVEKEYPEYVTPHMTGTGEAPASYHRAHEAVGEQDYHYSDTLKKDVCGKWWVYDTYSDRKTHYIILVEQSDDGDPNRITYMRCDMYNKEEPEEVYYTVSFFDDSEIEKPQMTTAVGDGKKVETGLIQEEREIPTSTVAGLSIAGWYVRGEPNKIYDVTEVKEFVVSGPVDFIAVIQEAPEYTIKYMGKNSSQEFIQLFPDSGIQDTKKYGKDEAATILGFYGEYQHDNGNNKKLLIGWSTEQGLGGNNQNIIKTKDAYNKIKDLPSFKTFGFGNSVKVSEYANKENCLVLYPVWGDLSWAKITIKYEVFSKDIGFGTVDPQSEALYFYETPQGSTATPKDGYEFDGWYEGNNLITDALTIKPEARSTTYTARFKELPHVTITYKAENGTIVTPGAVSGSHTQKINPVTGNPSATAKPLNEAYEFDYWTDTVGNRVPDSWLSKNQDYDVIKPEKDKESGKFISATYKAHYKLKNNGSLTVGKELSESSISLEGMTDDQKPVFKMVVIFRGIDDRANEITKPEGAYEITYKPGNQPSDFDIKKDREYHVPVKVGEKVTFGNIPRDVHYIVNEDVNSATYYSSTLDRIIKNDDEANPIKERANGDFVSNANQKVVFYNNVNYAMMDGELLIEKELESAESVDNVSFIFKIENIDEKSPKYGEVFYATVHITNGKTGSATLESIPVSEGYRVTEESHMRYQSSPEWYLVKVGTASSDAKPLYYLNGDLGLEEYSAHFLNKKTKDGYFSDSYMIVNKMSTETFTGHSYPGTKDVSPVKTLSLDYQPAAITGLGIDKDKIFENMDNDDSDLKSFVGTAYGF